MADYRTRMFDGQIGFGSGSKVNADDIPGTSTRTWLTNSLQSISGSKIFADDLNMNVNQVYNLAGPSGSWDATNKSYVDTVSGSIGEDLNHQILRIGTKFVSITVEDPVNNEDITICYFPVAVTITQLRAVVVGSSTPSVTIEPTWHADRSNAGYDLLTDAQAVTSETGENVDMGAGPNDNISAGSFLWLETTAKSGTVDELHLTFVFTED